MDVSQGLEEEAAPENQEEETAGAAEAKAPETVPMAVMLEERRKRQEMEARLAALEAGKSASPEAAPVGPKPGESLDPRDPDPYTKVSDDDYDSLMPSEQRKLQREHEAWGQREQMRVANWQRQQVLAEEEVEAKTRFTTETQGENLDFDTVLKVGMNFLTQADARALQKAADPAAKAYELCIERTPLLKALRDARKTGTLAPTGPEETLSVGGAPPARPVIRSTTMIGSIVDQVDKSPAGVAARLAEGG
jgi:hypothetical protein